MSVAVDSDSSRRTVWELSRANRPPDEAPSCDNPGQAALDLTLTAEVFACVVFVDRRHRRHAEPSDERPVLELEVARRQRGFIEDAIQRGFTVVIGVRASVSEMQERARAWGYETVGRGRFQSGDDHDPAAAAFEPKAFVEAVKAAAPLARTLCIFGHDADPLYLLTGSEG